MASPVNPADIFNVPPKREPGPPPIKLDENKVVLNTHEYSELFWYVDDKLSRKDRRDILRELDRAYVYRVLGGIGLMFASGFAASVVAKRVIPQSKRSMTVLGGILGAEFGSDSGFAFGNLYAQRDFQNRPYCRTVIRLVNYRPTLSLWINYYGDGHPPNAFSVWWRTNYEQINTTAYDGDDEPVSDEEIREEFDSAPDASAREPSSWDTISTRNRASASAPVPATTAPLQTASSAPGYEPPRYGSRASSSIRKYDLPPEEETQAEFDRKLDMERRGLDQPDDFTNSEKRFSSSKYD
ncbi:uncharacterized protein V1518DRAFT_417353 [Limtongia smithiae]|uniref:uncharacterized protein n=1 Tax=Limtongia smithiae TaxID=1125753 RepID=UPI0034CD9771